MSEAAPPPGSVWVLLSGSERSLTGFQPAPLVDRGTVRLPEQLRLCCEEALICSPLKHTLFYLHACCPSRSGKTSPPSHRPTVLVQDQIQLA